MKMQFGQVFKVLMGEVVKPCRFLVGGTVADLFENAIGEALHPKEMILSVA